MRSSTRPAAGRIVAAAVGLVLAATLAACSSSDESASDSSAGVPDRAVAEDAGAREIAGVDGASDDARSVITTGSLTVVATDPVATAQQIATMVETVGGRVESRSQSSTSDDDSDRTAYLRVRVPADSTNDTVRTLSKAGDVRDLLIDSVDVTSTAQDLDARIAALTTSTQRLRGLMADASSTADLLAAEKELTTRQADLESLQSQMASLSDQVAMSTLDISIVSEPQSEPSTDGFSGGFAAGWDALVATVGVAVVVVGALLPWIAVAVVIAVVVLGLRRRRRTARDRRESSPGGDGPDGDGHDGDGPDGGGTVPGTQPPSLVGSGR